MGKNQYLNHAHISEAKFKQILKEFCMDSTAKEASLRTSVSRVTINKIYKALRKRIFELTQRESEEMFSGEIELDESYFGPKRIRGKRGRGADKKIVVFGILKREGKVYTKPIQKASKAQILPILKGKVLDGSVVYTDGWKSYDGLIHNYKHYRIYHSKDEFARGKNHINGIESFWSFAKRRLQKFNGVQKKYFLLHLKESEWRFNHRHDDIYLLLLNELRRNPLGY